MLFILIMMIVFGGLFIGSMIVRAIRDPKHYMDEL